MQGPKCEGALVPSGAAGKLRISILACLVSALLEATSYSAWVVGRAVGRPRSLSQGVEPHCSGRVQASTGRVAIGENPLHARGAHVGGKPCVCAKKGKKTVRRSRRSGPIRKSGQVRANFLG